MTSFLGLLLLFPPMAEASRLPVIDAAPDFRLENSDGKKIRFADFRGQVVLVSFVFTTCNGSCPATTHRLTKVHDALEKKGLLKDKVRLVSITLDPERDRPEVLGNYMRIFEIDGKSWDFLTGAPAAVRKVHAAWGMWAKPAADGQLDHPLRIFLVDTRGQIREIYNLDFLRVPFVMEDIESLMREK